MSIKCILFGLFVAYQNMIFAEGIDSINSNSTIEASDSSIILEENRYGKKIEDMTMPIKSGRFHRKFVATWGGTDIPAANIRYQIFNGKGELLLEGRTNEAGETDLFLNQMPESLSIRLMKD